MQWNVCIKWTNCFTFKTSLSVCLFGFSQKRREKNRVRPFNFSGVGWVILKNKISCRHTCTEKVQTTRHCRETSWSTSSEPKKSLLRTFHEKIYSARKDKQILPVANHPHHHPLRGQVVHPLLSKTVWLIKWNYIYLGQTSDKMIIVLGAGGGVLVIIILVIITIIVLRTRWVWWMNNTIGR